MYDTVEIRMLLILRGKHGGLRSKVLVRVLKPIDELFLVLYQLRCNVLVKDLCYLFFLYPNFVSRILTTWINFLYEQTCCPTKNNIATEEFPAEPDTRTSILSFPLGVYSFLNQSKTRRRFSCGSHFQ